MIKVNGENIDKAKGRVALVSCDSYDGDKVKEAVKKAVQLLGGFEGIFACGDTERRVTGAETITRESRLVLKPNLLSGRTPEKACTTHPAVFGAAAELLKEAGYENLSYGDSPGNPVIKPEKIADECGLKAVADSIKIPFGRFDTGEQVDFPDGRVSDKFILCREIIEADGVINVCKMKTHQLERITGAVKNTFGCVFGVNKASSHARFSTAEVFAKMLADLNNVVAPRLHIMDGIVAMEGNGPQSGTPKAMNVILASADPVAMDGLFCRLVDLKPELVPTNVAAMEAGIGTYEDIVVVTEHGEMTAAEAAKLYGDRSFNVQRGREYEGTLKPIRLIMPLLQKKPIVKEERCVGCGVCVSSCPVEGKAVHIVKRSERGTGSNDKHEALHGVARYDYDKCIKCYCCQEMCPENAITVKKSLLARIADRKWNI